MREITPVHHAAIASIASDPLYALTRDFQAQRVGAEFYGHRYDMQGANLDVAFANLQMHPGQSLQHDLELAKLLGYHYDAVCGVRQPHTTNTMNLSFADFLVPEVSRRLISSMEGVGLSFSDLKFEVTEPKHNYSEAELDQIGYTIHQLGERGMKFLWDDWGQNDPRQRYIGKNGQGMPGQCGFKIDAATTRSIEMHGLNGQLSSRFKETIIAAAGNGEIVVAEGARPEYAGFLRQVFGPSTHLLLQGMAFDPSKVSACPTGPNVAP